MAKTHDWKVYSSTGEYLASCKYPEDAAAIVAAQGQEGTTVRLGHAKNCIAWTDGVDGAASESYDAVAVKCGKFQDTRRDAMLAKEATK